MIPVTQCEPGLLTCEVPSRADGALRRVTCAGEAVPTCSVPAGPAPGSIPVGVFRDSAVRPFLLLAPFHVGLSCQCRRVSPVPEGQKEDCDVEELTYLRQNSW